MLDVSTLKELLGKLDAQLAEKRCEMGVQRELLQRRACKLVGLHPKTYRHASTRPDDGALRTRVKLASQRRRFSLRRLGPLIG